MKKLFLSVFIVSLVGCTKEPSKNNDKKTDSTAQTNVKEPYPDQIKISKEESIKKANDDILNTLKNHDYKQFAQFIHPEKGVRFSMYAFVDPKEDKHFSKADFDKYQPTKTIFTWGTMDGSGDLYKATIDDYFTKWVYSKDFVTGQFSFNKFQGKGNSLNNLKEIYPKADFTENFIKGSQANAEMDWKCLRLVFEEFQGKYYLVGVINDQWTI
ncbi:hypothetical protein SAMN05421664_2201 [Chryseobacterium soldanellicola]|uniref:Lipoprotein n=1 Tax=Chryseobacterium soldanellicola TaxID=311333 RepID=A0A1H1CYW3_9FLAO|nr:hypothetical protein [Chryseobacterium soldanellicola]SDQ69413.1 hypothetical protein SAMN05421664_2201 [Chryseobacterium soldanellicola]